MNQRHWLRPTVWRTLLASASASLVVLAGCGGGNTGSERDSGVNKTTLSVEASDADGDTLQYQWRVTAGSVENRNAAQTVWTLPDGPGLHFAYVTISDGKGGYVEQQYAVASDALDTPAPVRLPVDYVAPTVTDISGSATRLRFVSSVDTRFTPPAGGSAEAREVYVAGMPVEVRDPTGVVVFSGLSDASGEVNLPRLVALQNYSVLCATSSGAALAPCTPLTGSTQASVSKRFVQPLATRNLRLYGHVAASDGSVCGMQDEFFSLQVSASVQLLQADGQAVTPAVRVNRFGDYALDAPVAAKGQFKLQVQCEAYSQTIDVPASPDPAGYLAGKPIELSHQIANQRPQVVKMVANGADGNVRGRMVVPEAAVVSNELPGARQFLSYKGTDSRASACAYYRSLGAVKDCDAQGGMVGAISFDDWKRRHQFKPYSGANAEVSANYINKMDLNLVRRMVATQTAANDIAFYVCNHPGPEGSSQAEVDEVLRIGLADEKRVACVAMEWSASPGVNGNQRFTKFLTFAPDGSLLPSVNLDGRGEKFLPGACVACHGGSQYNGRFAEKGLASPYLGSGFLPFDTGNYLFGTASALTEAAQGSAFHALNQLVRSTEISDSTAVSELVKGWYVNGGTTLDKAYVPPVWLAADTVAATAGASRFYREIVGASCRTCHVSLGAQFDWDSTLLSPARASTHVCGGTSDIATNASMPNALISRDRISQRVQADPSLAALMTTFLGCATPQPDAVYPKR